MKRCILSLVLLALLATKLVAVTYTYNSAGQLLSESYPNGAHVFYTYDTIGNLTQREVLAPNAAPSADLSITTSTSPDPAIVGGVATITITVTNSGPDPATEVTVTDTLPAALEPISVEVSQGGASFAGNLLTANLGTLQNGQSVVITAEARVLAIGALANTATVTAPEDSNAANDTANSNTAVDGGVDLTVDVVQMGEPMLDNGSFAFFIVSVTNNGPSDATGVTHTFTLPAELTFLFAAPSQGGFSEAAGVVTSNLGNLAVGTSAQVTIGALTTIAGTFPSTQAVAANETDIDPLNDNQTLNLEVLSPTLVVTNTNDAGAGSLRQAILDANAAPDADIIGFDIAGFAVPSLTPLTDLPEITAPVFIDAFSAEANAFEINGTNVTDGLVIKSDDVTLRGLTVNRCGRDGLTLVGPGGFPPVFLTGIKIQGCIFGADTDAVIARPNGRHGLLIDGIADSMIGGNQNWMGNMFSGNALDGVHVDAGQGFQITGNCIGTVADGSAALPNGDEGIELGGSTNGAIIGSEDGSKGNIISGNGGFGFVLFGEDNFVWGNKIGTDITGQNAVPNDDGGIRADGNGNVIGGANPLRSNLISGNAVVNIDLFDGPRVIGNLIGPDVDQIGTPTGAPSNVEGVRVRDRSTLGGVLSGEGNVISANTDSGVFMSSGDGLDAIIAGNFIGTDRTGTQDLGNATEGILSRSNEIAPKHIGLPVHGGGNVISGNGDIGVSIEDFSSGAIARNHRIQNNKIGTDITGTAPIPNDNSGVEIGTAGADNLIGGVDMPLVANVIAFNGRPGVRVNGGGTLRNRILGNSIHSNDELGISLGAAIVPVPNDPGDVDSGPNNRQNFPVVTMADTGGFVIATLNSEADKTFRIEFFSNTACDPSGNGEGETFLGAKELVTDGTGDGSVTFFTPALAENAFVTATATDPDGNTSEFGPCFTVVAQPAFADQDGDGMSDAYELEHFGSETGGDSNADDDDDGRKNIAEFVALTDPKDGTSFLAVSIERNPVTGSTILVKTEPFRFYQIQCSENLDRFISLGSREAGDGNLLEFIDRSHGVKKYYRIVVSR
ncbi:MAG: hypothetical protein AAGA58_07360 [Verrucomicrobiota bacterium]